MSVTLSKPTNGSNADYVNRIGLLFDAYNNGNYSFPSTQSASADANVLDDYEEGTFTPAFTFTTPGNLAVTYSTQLGIYTKIGRLVHVHYEIVSSAFTHSTASGNARVTGLPFTVAGASNGYTSKMEWSGVTKASYTELHGRLGNGGTVIDILASGSGQAEANVSTANIATGSSIIFIGDATFFTS